MQYRLCLGVRSVHPMSDFCTIKSCKKITQLSQAPNYHRQALNILKDCNQSTQVSLKCVSWNKLTMNVLKFESLSSTMTMSGKWPRDNLNSNNHFLFIAQQQLNGRGQRENKWLSPPGNIYCTLLTRQPINALQLLYVASAVSLTQTIESQFKPVNPVQLKWVNDLYIGDKKFGGILINSDVQNLSAVVQIGIGINVNSAPAHSFTCIHEHQLDQSSLASQSQLESAIVKVALNILNSYSSIANQRQLILNQFRERLMMKKKKVIILDSRLQKVLAKGKFLDVNDNGFALLETESGIIEVTDGRMRIQQQF